jgi:hypothetical protein
MIITESDRETIREIDERNAKCMATWLFLWRTRARCADYMSPGQRMYADLCLEHDRRLARAWLRANVKPSNVVPLRRRKEKIK